MQLGRFDFVMDMFCFMSGLTSSLIRSILKSVSISVCLLFILSEMQFSVSIIAKEQNLF